MLLVRFCKQNQFQFILITRVCYFGRYPLSCLSKCIEYLEPRLVTNYGKSITCDKSFDITFRELLVTSLLLSKDLQFIRNCEISQELQTEFKLERTKKNPRCKYYKCLPTQIAKRVAWVKSVTICILLHLYVWERSNQAPVTWNKAKSTRPCSKIALVTKLMFVTGLPNYRHSTMFTWQWYWPMRKYREL